MGYSERRVAQARLCLANRQANSRYISPKQIESYHWRPRSGVIFYKNGIFIRGDRLGGLWASFDPSPNRKFRTPDLRSITDRVDPYIYFSIGDKYYKTDLVLPIR